MQQLKARVEQFAQEVNRIPSPNATSSSDSPAIVGDQDPYLKPLAWYPDCMGWQVQGGKTKLRKTESVDIQRLRAFIIDQTAIGHLSRQEAVSMVPPLFMNVQEHHKVLDMCAAPGSKTAQLIEMLHRDAPEPYNPTSLQSTRRTPGYHGMVRGFVHANDAASKRCNTLITQTRRLASPSLLVTHHDAQSLPTVHIAKDETSTQITTSHDLPLGAPFHYDRILCDVPCSGDGTMRKNADVWAKWTPTSGHGMHPIQLAILLRAIELSAPGARIVYSTCSMNPVEDEAVIAAAIQAAEHPMKLVDVSLELPLLKRRSGIHQWKCMDNAGNWYDKAEEVPEALKKRLAATSFPPALEVAQTLHLERCMRFLPHDQDTGGFFVAVLERIDGQPAQEEALNKKKRNKKKSKNQAEFEKLDAKTADSLLPSITHFFHLNEHFPTTHLVRHRVGLNKLYLTTHAAAILMENDIAHKLRLKTVGTRVFEHVANTRGSPCHYRLTQDGIETMYPFLGLQRVIELKEASDLELILGMRIQPPQGQEHHDAPALEVNQEAAQPLVEASNGKKSGEELPDVFFSSFSAPVASALEAMDVGSIVYSYHIPLGNDLPPHHTLLVGWRGKVSANALVSRAEAAAVKALYAKATTVAQAGEPSAASPRPLL